MPGPWKPDMSKMKESLPLNDTEYILKAGDTFVLDDQRYVVFQGERGLHVKPYVEPTPPSSLHEKIFWEIRSSGKDERELADWICALVTEEIGKVPGLDLFTQHDGHGGVTQPVVNRDLVLALFVVPEGRSAPEVEQAVEEHFALALRCQAAIHPGMGRTRACVLYVGHDSPHIDSDGEAFTLPVFIDQSVLCGIKMWGSRPCQRVLGHEGNHQAV